jgi:hypothetical protein
LGFRLTLTLHRLKSQMSFHQSKPGIFPAESSRTPRPACH